MSVGRQRYIHNRLQEDLYRGEAFSTVGDVLTYSCKNTRRNIGGDSICCNNHRCIDKFGISSVAVDAIIRFRGELWAGLRRSNHMTKWTMRDRRAELKAQLTSMCSGDRVDGSFCINYVIRGVPVCKDFFRRATRFERKMFNAVHRSFVGY